VNPPLATLIGDVVASKRHADRPRLQRTLRRILDDANTALGPEQPLELTVGDEFQGAFRDIASAAWASFVIRLALLERSPSTDTRYGLGYGPITVFDADRKPISQDGPGWWAARVAIEHARALAASSRTASARTSFGRWDTQRDAFVADGAMEAFLLCRDSIIGSMTNRQRRLLLGIVSGRSQETLAQEEKITQGAVSQSLHRSGAFVVAEAHLLLRGGESEPWRS
jgi:hypothetical protein